LFIAVALLCAVPAVASDLQSALVQTSGATGMAAFDGVVEAVRQTVIASQVQGSVVELTVKAGDTVKAGQVLLRIDARAATQNSAASLAQVQAAQAALEVADKDVARQRQLHAQKYISQAALDRAEATFRATTAQLKAEIAQSSAAQIQSGFYIVRAPYAGVLAEVPVMPGDMAMPGRPLITMYDPSALRVTAAVPQSALAGLAAEQAVKLEFPDLPAERRWLARPGVQVLPTLDAGTHSALVRSELPADYKGLAPGLFARLWLTDRNASSVSLSVPASAVVRRAEMTGLYVIDGAGQAILRQVRLGSRHGDSIEVLSGVSAGERIALDPQAAAKGGR
jgi:RND family efflux transporter MFP subunit